MTTLHATTAFPRSPTLEGKSARKSGNTFTRGVKKVYHWTFKPLTKSTRILSAIMELAFLLIPMGMLLGAGMKIAVRTIKIVSAVLAGTKLGMSFYTWIRYRKKVKELKQKNRQKRRVNTSAVKHFKIGMTLLMKANVVPGSPYRLARSAANLFVGTANIINGCVKLKEGNQDIKRGRGKQEKWEQKKALFSLMSRGSLRAIQKIEIIYDGKIGAFIEEVGEEAVLTPAQLDRLSKWVQIISFLEVEGKERIERAKALGDRLVRHAGDKIKNYKAMEEKGKFQQTKAWISIAVNIAKLALVVFGIICLALSFTNPYMQIALLVTGIVLNGVSFGKMLWSRIRQRNTGKNQNWEERSLMKQRQLMQRGGSESAERMDRRENLETMQESELSLEKIYEQANWNAILKAQCELNRDLDPEVLKSHMRFISQKLLRISIKSGFDDEVLYDLLRSNGNHLTMIDLPLW